MLKIRLTQKGKRHAQTYRIVVTEARSRRDGLGIEEIGRYNPTVTPAELIIDQDRMKYWVSQGAQISTGVQKIIEPPKTKATAKK